MDSASAIGRDRAAGEGRRPWRRRLGVAAGVALLVVVVTLFVFTDSAPSVAPPPPPTAEQVGAVRAAVRQFRDGQAGAGRSDVRLDAAQLAGVGALASNGFRPDRLLAEVRGRTIRVAGSHRLPLGRWLNVTVVSPGGGGGFPPAELSVGSVTFSPSISRRLFELARWAGTLRGIRLPPLDRLVSDVSVAGDAVSATVRLPRRSGILARLGDDGRTDPAAVRAIYCRLVRRHATDPTTNFALQVRRAFELPQGTAATPGSNRAAFIALAMLTVEPRIGDLAGVAPERVADCRAKPVAIALNDRTDLAKHWALSAALAVATGTQFSQAIGEWKELADSIARQSRFGDRDPSGFSLLDLAADRSGFLTAGLGVQREHAERVAAALARAEQQDLMPRELMHLADGLPNAVFVRRFGSTEDPRFLAATARIDAALRQSAAARRGPLAALPAP